MAQRGILASHRLRHLEGISLRNLSISKPQAQPRGRTIDDDSVPTSLATTAKLFAARTDSGKLEHSKSSVDLKTANEEAVSTTLGPSSPKVKSRKGALRRRSTLNWSNETPNERQKLLEDAVVERRLDTFFSLHRVANASNGPPLYVSETKERSMNPDFQYFSLRNRGLVSAEEAFVLKVWTTSGPGREQESILLLEMDVQMRTLKYIGKSLHNFHRPFSENSVIFYLSDGIYTDFFDLPNANSSKSSGLSQLGSGQTSDTSSLDALMQLNNQAECIDDALRTRDKLVKQLEALIRDNENTAGKITLAQSARASAGMVEDGVGQLKRETNRLKHQMAQVNADLKHRRRTIGAELAAIKKYEESLAEEEEDLLSLEPMRSELKVRIASHVRRIAQSILDIYPIQPIENRPLCFTIRDLHLPNASSFSKSNLSDFSSEEDVTAAALGHVAFVTNYLALTLSIPLPYSIFSRGSTSTIFDPLTPNSLLGHSGPSATYLTTISNSTSTTSTTKSSFNPSNPAPTPENSPWRLFTFSQKGGPAARFAWAVYLLNKDLEELMSKCSLKIVDPRNTLANLKYVLTVLASGKGNVPARKRGVLRGLSAGVGGGGEIRPGEDLEFPPAPSPTRVEVEEVM